MTEKEKQLKREIKSLREQLNRLREDRDEILADRALFRTHFVRRLKWWIELHRKGMTPNMSWLIEDDSKALTWFKPWYWV